MNLQAILAILQAVAALIESLKGLGLDLSGVKLHTSTPIDLSRLLPPAPPSTLPASPQ